MKSEAKPRYSIIVGDTFRAYTGTSTCSGLRPYAIAFNEKEMKEKLAQAFDEYGLATVIDLETGREPEELEGNCYYTCEALYHLMGGKDGGWKPMQMVHDGKSHWFLQHERGLIVDPTVSQFEEKPDYTRARGRGFLTKEPSKKAREMMQALVYKSANNLH